MFWSLRSLLFGSPGAAGGPGGCPAEVGAGGPAARAVAAGGTLSPCAGLPPVPSARSTGPLLLPAPLRHGGAALGCGDRRWHRRHQPGGTGCSKHSAWGGGEPGKGRLLVCTRSPSYPGSPAVVLGTVRWLPVPVAPLALLGGVPRQGRDLPWRGAAVRVRHTLLHSSRPRPGWQLGAIRFSSESWQCRFCREVWFLSGGCF